MRSNGGVIYSREKDDDIEDCDCYFSDDEDENDTEEMISILKKFQKNNGVPSFSPCDDEEEDICDKEDDCNEDEDDEEEEDLESSLLFLDQKRGILKRVCDLMFSNEMYDASVARESSQIEEEDSEIFTEAKDLIAALNRKTNDTTVSCPKKRKVTFHVTNTPKTMEKRKKLRTLQRNKSRIDISSVNRINSELYSQSEYNTNTLSSSSEIPYDDTKWSLTLEQIHRDLNNTNEEEQQRQQSRDSEFLNKILSERNSIFQQISSTAAEIRAAREMQSNYSTTIEDALAITDRPQIISQASSPFLAIHANRAFFNLSGLSTEDVVGKSVEEIVETKSEDCCMRDILLAASSLRQDNTELDSKSNGKLNNDNAIIILGGMNCQFRVKPISSNSDRGKQTFSHLMVQISSNKRKRIE